MPSKPFSWPMGESVLTLAGIALLFAACGRSDGLSMQRSDAAVSPDTLDSARDWGIGVVIRFDAAKLDARIPQDAYVPCGNGIFDPDEACDDGNTVSGDGCSADAEPSSPAGIVWRRDAPARPSAAMAVVQEARPVTTATPRVATDAHPSA